MISKRLPALLCAIVMAASLLMLEAHAKASPVTVTHWREVEPQKWSSEQALDWLRSVLYSKDSPVDSHRRHVVLEDFEKHRITGSQLMDWLKHGMNSQADVFKHHVKEEDTSTRSHIMEQLRDLVHRFRPTLHHGVENIVRDRHESDRHDYDHKDKYFERDSTKKHHDRDVAERGLFGLLSIRPISWIWSTFRWVLSPIISLFQLGGLLFILSSLISRRETQGTLLDRSSTIFRRILSEFYSMFESRVVSMRDKSQTKSSALMMAMRILIAGPTSIIGGPFVYLMCVFRVLGEAIMNSLPALLPVVLGLPLAYFLLPEALWTPLSFFLFNILGTYGVIRFLVRAYNIIASMLITHTSSVIPQKQVQGQDQISQSTQQQDQSSLKSSVSAYPSNPIQTSSSSVSTSEHVPSTVATESNSAGSAPGGVSSSFQSSPLSTSDYSASSSIGYGESSGIKNVEGRHDLYAPTMATKRHTGAA